jgi:Zn-dependent M28 family amino/carboxypeptidase
VRGDSRQVTAELESALQRHVAALTVEIGPRAVGIGAGLDRAADYIRNVFQTAGLKVSAQSYRYRGQAVANLIAALPQHAEAAPYYLGGAHYDPVPGTPGADDNASAVAVLLELGRRLPEIALPGPVRLVAFTLEEPPAYLTRNQGSRVFVRRARKAGERVVGAIVLEMVGYTTARQRYPLALRWVGYPEAGDFIGIVGNRRSRRFGGRVLEGFRRNPSLPVESLFIPFDGWILPATRLSDHASFWDVGWPALMVTDTAFFRNPNYHLSSDTMDTLDFSFMAKLVTSLEASLAILPQPDSL